MKQHGEILRTSEGNAIRTRSIGVLGPDQNDQTLENWKQSVLQRLEGKFESV
ncbi:hypothetical protein LEP1GSC038_0764 [Leptospira weilii str. 2006001855]|uniref:Uncharacterized protein n=1 Tax=Leptospira weilii str. 2006001855 TaxID=996804 RepID=M6FPS7_9LEPT|nr:hypothetical protein LEP1GSC038_0764 [Leptospira weilii str. 2006001855]